MGFTSLLISSPSKKFLKAFCLGWGNMWAFDGSLRVTLQFHHTLSFKNPEKPLREGN